MKSSFVQIIIACLLGIVSLIGFRFWYGMIETKSADVAVIEAKIASHTEAEARLSADRASLTQIAAYETTIQSYFVADTEVVSFIDMLEKIGTTQKATVNVLSVAKGGSDAQPFLTLTLEITGAFDAVLRTLGVIEYAPYELTITALSLQHDEKTAWHGALTLVVGSVPVAATTATTTPKTP